MSERDTSVPTISAGVRLEMIKRRRAQQRGRRILAGVTLVVAFLVVRAIVSPDPSLVADAPPSIIGTWITDDERYQDREFIILEDEFRIQVGAGLEDIRAYPLRDIRQFEEEGGTRFEIVYATSDGDSVHEMTLLADGTARLRNPREVVWIRR